jgi:hypothetical protein
MTEEWDENKEVMVFVLLEMDANKKQKHSSSGVGRWPNRR